MPWIGWRSSGGASSSTPKQPRGRRRRHDECLAERTGRSLDEVNLTNERVTALAAAEGLAYDFGRYTVVNTLDAHRVDVGTAPRRDRSEGAGSASGGGLGLVAGGRVALLQAIPTLAPVELVGDEAVGLGILRRALEAPLRQIADNAGAHGEVIVEHVKTLPPGHGFDALKGDYGDMFTKGIVDAAKVTRSALQNAASIAAMVLTTETLITDLPEKKQAVPAGGGGYGGDMDY